MGTKTRPPSRGVSAAGSHEKGNGRLPRSGCFEIAGFETIPGKEMCEKLWDNSFKYEPNEAAAYSWSFSEGTRNPNHDVLPGTSFPPQVRAQKASSNQ